MQSIYQIALYVVSVLVSQKYAAGYWVVGPVFAIAVILAGSRNPKEIGQLRHALFFLLSTSIYALVYRISLFDWNPGSELLKTYFGSFSTAVVTGSVLMVWIRTVLYRESGPRAKRGMIQLISSFYFVMTVMVVCESLKIAQKMNWITAAIAVWQGVYLMNFLPTSQREVPRA